jgi:hypothetical protein
MVALLLLAGCGKKEPDYNGMLLTSAVKAAVAAPDRVTILRLHPGPYPNDGRKYEDWPDAPSTAQLVADRDTAAELVRLLSNEQSYGFAGKGCKPSPGVKIQFTRGGTMIEAYLCFECRMLAYYGPGASGGRAWGDFDPIYAPLQRIVQKTFPDDPGLKSLR